MNTYLLLFIISACASLVLTPTVRRICERLKWLDIPHDGRRLHRRPIPRLGGVAIFLSAMIALAALLFLQNFVTSALIAQKSQLYSILIPATVVLLFGVYDDLRGSSAKLKFIVQALAGLMFCALGGSIDVLTFPLVGPVNVPPVIGYALVVLWTVGISNAFNLIDGMDGLAAGASLFAALVMFVVSLMLGQPTVTVLSVVLCGSLIGFLRYNFNPASIFLGDSGALFVGFMLAALSVTGAQKATTAVAVAIPLLAFGVPIVDTGVAMVRRYISGRPLFEGDREHIHHKLLERGWSQRRVALVFYAACAVFGLLALLLVHDSGMRTTGLVLVVVGVAVTFTVGHLRYHEVEEVKAGVKRNFGERRLRFASNIRVRQASRTMSRATTLREIFSAMQELLVAGEFVYATIKLGREGCAEAVERALLREEASGTLRHAELRDGLICWSWERGDIEVREILESGRFWTIGMPLATTQTGWGYVSLYRPIVSDSLLIDINYLCELFQREMALAVERVFVYDEQEADIPQLVANAATGR